MLQTEAVSLEDTGGLMNVTAGTVRADGGEGFRSSAREHPDVASQ